MMKSMSIGSGWSKARCGIVFSLESTDKCGCALLHDHWACSKSG